MVKEEKPEPKSSSERLNPSLCSSPMICAECSRYAFWSKSPNMVDEYIFVNYGGKIIGRGTASELMETEGVSIDTKFREVFRYA